MKIIVCIKQVPGTSQVEVDPETGVLKRSGVPSKMNPYDLYAIEAGVRLKEQYGGSVTALTMGPPQAESVIREAFSMGVDDGVLISDRRFGGADVLATSYTISQAIRTLGDFDLILCGKQTTDGDTAQVGSELAEFLDIPSLSGVSKILKVSAGSTDVTLNMQEDLVEAKVKFPCLLSLEKDIYPPRLPSYRLKTARRNDSIKTFSLDDLIDKNEENYGLSGSPTQVVRIFPPDNTKSRVLFEEDAEGLSARAFSLLEELKFIDRKAEV